MKDGFESRTVIVGQTIEPFSVQTIQGSQIAIPDRSFKLTHLQFRRFAGCPICNFHLHTFFKRAAELDAAGVREVIFFHSSAEQMRHYQKDIAHLAVADHSMKWYRRFGVSRSPWASMHPSALWAGTRGMFMGMMGVRMENGPLGLPADILIDSTGSVVAAKYGTHAYDQWEVDEVLAFARPMATTA